LLAIVVYLSIKQGWPVMIFALIGGVCCLYANVLIHHKYQMAFGAMFLVIGAFYVQVGTLFLSYHIWLSVICISLFAFFSQYGWLLLYRLDDYKYDNNVKNKGILLTKSSLFFLILYFILQL